MFLTISHYHIFTISRIAAAGPWQRAPSDANPGFQLPNAEWGILVKRARSSAG